MAAVKNNCSLFVFSSPPFPSHHDTCPLQVIKLCQQLCAIIKGTPLCVCAQVTHQILMATTLIIGGCVTLMVYGNHESPVLSVAQLLSLYHRPAYITYLTLLAACALSSFLVYQYGRTRAECVPAMLMILPWLLQSVVGLLMEDCGKTSQTRVFV